MKKLITTTLIGLSLAQCTSGTNESALVGNNSEGYAYNQLRAYPIKVRTI